MAPVHALDRYYLGVTILVTIGYQLLGFAIAWTFQFDKITDFTGGKIQFLHPRHAHQSSSFLLGNKQTRSPLALLTLLIGNTFYARNIVVSVLVMVWATRLAGFLLFRVLKTGSDTRFDDIRSHFLSFLGFWIGQIVWVWTVSLPVTILNSPAVSDPALGGSNPAFGTSRDIAGIVLWALGFAIESVADAQKFYHKSTHPPKNARMADNVPVAELVRFHATERCLSDPAVFKALRDLAERARPHGMTGQYWAKAPDDPDLFVWILLWDSRQHHTNWLASDKGTAGALSMKAAELAKEPFDIIHVHFETHPPFAALTMPMTEVVFWTIADADQVGAFFEKLEKTRQAIVRGEGMQGCTWGQSLERKDAGVALTGWESLEAQMKQGDSNKDYRETGEEALSLVSDLRALRVNFQPHI
ncbi:hypothetical protein EWM64_g6969 [Hericium alpestre]|uniref:ABM domain-containing protein n=1 Tax=Hericium alpestre TaxID=135208 RepID=A0A4Y9ZSM6_9AGAM|nr:hypothetical protein EWM64_g6969 [Hericium alpestre]